MSPGNQGQSRLARAKTVKSGERTEGRPELKEATNKKRSILKRRYSRVDTRNQTGLKKESIVKSVERNAARMEEMRRIAAILGQGFNAKKG